MGSMHGSNTTRAERALSLPPTEQQARQLPSRPAGLLLDVKRTAPLDVVQSSAGPLLLQGRGAQVVRLWPTHHQVNMTRYATSTDARGYLACFEYNIASICNANQQHTIMIDCETGYVQFTSIWKALGHTKADVVKLIESAPELAERVNKIRGGQLKIQGTWLPYEVADALARRVAFRIAKDLIPLFGPDFPDKCLRPGDAGYGVLVLSQSKQRNSTSRRSRIERMQAVDQRLVKQRADPQSRSTPPGAFFHSHGHGQHQSGPQSGPMNMQRYAAQNLQHFQPYGQVHYSPIYHTSSTGNYPTMPLLPTPPQTGRARALPEEYVKGLPVSRWMAIRQPPTPLTGSNWSSASPHAAWRQSYRRSPSPGALVPRDNALPSAAPFCGPQSARSEPTDEDAVVGLMTMAKHPLILPKLHKGSPTTLYSIPSGQPPSPRSALHPIGVSTSAGARCIPPVSSATWTPGHLASRRGTESNVRSGSAEPPHTRGEKMTTAEESPVEAMEGLDCPQQGKKCIPTQNSTKAD